MGYAESWPQTNTVLEGDEIWMERLEALKRALERASDEHRRAECMNRIQSDAMQLALDLLVREPDITGFFRVFIKRLVEESESHACGVWLLDENGSSCQLWMAYLDRRFYTKEGEDWEALALPRDSMAAHLMQHREGWAGTVEYGGQDQRLPAFVRDFNQQAGVQSVLVSPLVLPTR